MHQDLPQNSPLSDRIREVDYAFAPILGDKIVRFSAEEGADPNERANKFIDNQRDEQCIPAKIVKKLQYSR